jgi:hypothetical protein
MVVVQQPINFRKNGIEIGKKLTLRKEVEKQLRDYFKMLALCRF